MRLKKGDTVQAIGGAYRGKSGKVIRIYADQGRIVVEGLNMKKKHTRPRKQGQKGQVIEFPAPMHISNVMLKCPKCGKAVRVEMRLVEGEKKRRMCKRCKQVID